MSFFALFGLAGAEILLIFALILILFGATKFPGFSEGFRQGVKEFRKATREVDGEIAAQPHGERSNDWRGHPVLVALTFILGAACIILVVYEFSK